MLRRYTTQFWTLCTCSLLFFASFNMIIPELPDYLTSLGGGEYKGLIISLFTLTAMASRPFSGKLADHIGRVPVMIVGVAVCVLCGVLYPVMATVAGFLFLRLIHGFSTGFTPTGTAAYLSDLIPMERRGEAMGLLGTMSTVGMALGPALGGLLANHLSINVIFYSSSVAALGSVGLLFTLRETLQEKRAFASNHLKIQKKDVVESRVLIPCLVIVLAVFAYGALLTVLPDFSEYVGIANKGLLFTYFTIATLLVRIIAGRVSDLYGRRTVLRFSTLLLTGGVLVIAFSTTAAQLILGVMIYGMAHGMTSPTLLAWAVDLSDEKHRARGLASLYMAMEFGIGVGALISGWLLTLQSENFTAVFAWCGVLAGSAFLFLLTPYSSPRTVPS